MIPHVELEQPQLRRQVHQALAVAPRQHFEFEGFFGAQLTKDDASLVRQAVAKIEGCMASDPFENDQS